MSSGRIGFDDGAQARVGAVDAVAVLIGEAFTTFRREKAPLQAMLPGDDAMTKGLREHMKPAEEVIDVFEKAFLAAASGQGDKLGAALDVLRKAEEQGILDASFFPEGSGKRG